MKALRYLLILVVMMGVLSISAQTPKYGKPYTPSNGTFYNPQAQMPEIQMRSTGSAIMYTGSALPFAASEGVTTTYSTARVGPRRVGENEGTEDEDDPDNPGEPFPVGDAVWPLALLACVYLIVRVVRKRKSAMSK